MTHYETEHGDKVYANAMEVRVVKLLPDAVIPAYAHEGDSGMDLVSPVSLMLFPGIPAFVDLGIAVEIPAGYEGQIRSRSGLTKKGITACSGIGTVDSSYRGSIGVTLMWHASDNNLRTASIPIAKGDRIAQLVIVPVVRARLIEVASVEELTPTGRGSAGFGSTGVR